MDFNRTDSEIDNWSDQGPAVRRMTHWTAERGNVAGWRELRMRSWHENDARFRIEFSGNGMSMEIELTADELQAMAKIAAEHAEANRE